MITPAGYRVLVRPDPVQEETDWGFELRIDERLERAAQVYGELVAVGAFAWAEDEEPWAKVGDRVAYIKHAGKFLQDPETEEELVILNDADILAVVS